MSITITIDDREVRQMLRAAPGQIRQAQLAAMNDATSLLLRDMSTYPAQRAGSSYTRTHVLQKSWSRVIEQRGRDITGRVGSNQNIAPYNRVVQDADMQARQHRGTWKNTAQAVTKQREAAIQKMFRTRLKQFVG